MSLSKINHKLAIIIPAMNESSSIATVINDIKAHCKCLIIVVDDASDDDTGAIARRNGAVVLEHAVNMGAWKASQTGIRYALTSGINRVITMDADGQHKAKNIPELIETSDSGVDVVIGSCTSRGSIGRHLAWRFFKWLTGLNVSDLTSGFRCYNTKAMIVLSSREATMIEYQDIGVLLLLSKASLKIKEVSAQMVERESGISRIFYSWLAVFKYLTYTLVLCFAKLDFSPQSKSV